MATSIGCIYYYLLFLLWFLSSITFFVHSHVVLLRWKLFILGNIHQYLGTMNRSMSTSFAQCWDQLISPIMIMPIGLYTNLPTTHVLSFAFHS
ncbi:unnamed protein product [Trifolium pratense]|uniref:Uncharacterized protein n=1 Tax=Trifolium pratense TaxID=57577 RepID=A0ACB0LSF8_TRIPR|nr:unnamed protein product [Trifolium pratense]